MKSATLIERKLIERPVIFDCSIFNGNEEALKFRLQYLDNIVDYFVVIEQQKQNEKSRLQEFTARNLFIYAHKFVGMTVPEDFPNPFNLSGDEFLLSNLTKSLDPAAIGDIFVFSLENQLPDPEKVIEYRNSGALHPRCLLMQNFREYINFTNVGVTEPGSLIMNFQVPFGIVNLWRIKQFLPFIENGGYYDFCQNS